MRTLCLAWLMAIAVPALAANPPARPVPPGTPERYVAQRPVPPYAAWPEDAPDPFETLSACRTWFRERSPTFDRAFIRRFDVVHRRCVREQGAWRYRESHAPTVLDPVLEPLLIGVPVTVWLATRKRRLDVVDRGEARWVDACAGGGCDGPTEPPSAAWTTLADAWVIAGSSAAAAPVLFSRGNARGTDTLIMAEVMAFDVAVTRAATLRRAEARPSTDAALSAWTPGTPLPESVQHRDAWTAGPSLNVSMVAASSFGLATLGALHDERGRLAPVLLGYLAAAAATTGQGVGEVMAQRADGGDVAVGATIGLCLGVLVPYSHFSISRTVDPVRRQDRLDQKPSTVRAAPTFSRSGVGLVGTF